MLFQESCYHQALIWHAIRSTYRLVVKPSPHHRKVVVRNTRDLSKTDTRHDCFVPHDTARRWASHCLAWRDWNKPISFLQLSHLAISRDSTKRNLRESPCEGVRTSDNNRHWHFHMVVHSKPIAVKLTSPATYHGVVRCCVPTLISIRRPCIQSSKKIPGSCGWWPVMTVMRA